MPKRYCGPSPFNGRMARRECQRCFNGSTLRLKMFLSSHSLFRIFSLLLFSFCFNLTFGVSNFFPSSFWLCGLNWGWRRPKSLSERFGAFHMVALGLGWLGQSHLCCGFAVRFMESRLTAFALGHVLLNSCQILSWSSWCSSLCHLFHSFWSSRRIDV